MSLENGIEIVRIDEADPEMIASLIGADIHPGVMGTLLLKKSDTASFGMVFHQELDRGGKRFAPFFQDFTEPSQERKSLIDSSVVINHNTAEVTFIYGAREKIFRTLTLTREGVSSFPEGLFKSIEILGMSLTLSTAQLVAVEIQELIFSERRN